MFLKKRPAETTTASAAIAYLLVYLAGVDDEGVLVALGIVIGFIPTAVTWAVVTFRSGS